MLHAKKDYKSCPKFRHNLWTSYADNPNTTYLVVSHGTYEVSTNDAADFIKIRSYCTGYNTIPEIAQKSNMPLKKVRAIINSLAEINVLHLPFKDLTKLPRKLITKTLLDATKIWGEQLADTYISSDIFLGKSTKAIVIGWLLETYHYIKAFPEALQCAAAHSTGELKELLQNYAAQEKGHEKFILKTLLKAGLSQQEIEDSIPLVSTRTIDMLLKELFSFEPCTVLLVASIIEAEDYNPAAAKIIAQRFNEIYGFPVDMMDDFFKHVEIDSKLGHQKLLKNNIKFLKDIKADKLHNIVNKIHDIKHAFDLQKLEIKEYYSTKGNYLPRQKVDFFAI